MKISGLDELVARREAEFDRASRHFKITHAILSQRPNQDDVDADMEVLNDLTKAWKELEKARDMRLAAIDAQRYGALKRISKRRR